MDNNCFRGKVLPFSTESGNRYIYDNYSGLTFPEEPSVLKKLNGGYLGIDRTSAPLPGKIDEQMVKVYIAGHSYNQLTLEMTAECNFRCKCCIYGEHYPETRTWTHQNMNFDTAKKAVDYYMAGVMCKFRKNPNAYPTIGFYCGKIFCPICFSEPAWERELTVEQWSHIIDDLAETGCKTVMLTGGESLLYEGLTELIEHAKSLGMAVSVQTGGEISLDNIPADVTVSVLLNKSSDIERILQNLRGRKRVSLILQGVEDSVLGGRADKAWDVRRIGTCEPIHGKRHLTSLKMDDFFYRKLKDPCLNGKMYVLADGSVVPCFQGRGDVLGNLLIDDFSRIFQKLTMEYWFAAIDDRLSGKRCQDCELKYACPSCRYTDPEASCLYDPA